MHLAAVLARTQERLKQAALAGYTIQLAALYSTTNPNHYLAMVTAQLDPSNIYAQPSVYKGKIYMSIYFGNFESIDAAAAAIDGLPELVKKSHPLVRSWDKIKQERAS